MEDDNSMSERILRTLETILTSDPELKEFAIIPADVNTKNKSPVLYEEHNIGLESWCVKHIYRYAYLELFEARPQLSKKKLSFYKEQNLNHLLIGALLINPDVSTFWNMKRELVEKDVISASNELLFTKMVLTYKSKSNEAFGYRRWLLNRILAKLPEGEALLIHTLLENELGVCEMAAGKNPNNYHAWTHRIWCMETIASRVTGYSNLILQELELNQQWLSQHVSEHTGYHYREYLLNAVRKSRKITHVYELYYNEVLRTFRLVNENDPRDILTFLLGKDKLPLEETNNFVNYFCLLLFDLYNTLEMLNSVFPNHESVWYYRRYLLYHLIKTAYEYYGLVFKVDEKPEEIALYGTNIVNVDNDGETQPKLFKTHLNKVESSVFYRNLVKNERECIRKNLTNSTVFYEQELVKRYERWLKFVLGMKDV